MNEKYRRKSQFLSVDMDGDLVMMDVEKGDYFGIDGIGPDIWALLETPKSTSELVALICDQYDVDVAVASADIQDFINSLAESDLIEILPADG